MIEWLIRLLSMIAIGSATPIAPDQPVTVALDGLTPAYYTFTGEAGQAVTIDLLQADDDAVLNNPVVGLIADHRLLVFNNDANPETKDAQISAYILPITGEYLIFADTYGGIYAGDLTLNLSFVDPFRAEILSEQALTTIRAYLPQSQTYRHVMDLQADETIKITAQALSDELDLVVWLVDDAGEVVVWNDDHIGNDSALKALDAQIDDFVIPSDGTFSIIVSELLGISGEFLLTIKQD